MALLRKVPKNISMVGNLFFQKKKNQLETANEYELGYFFWFISILELKKCKICLTNRQTKHISIGCCESVLRIQNEHKSKLTQFFP